MTDVPTKDDPLKPYKAIVGALGASAVAIIGAGLDLPVWLRIVLIGLAAFAGAYVVRNPSVEEDVELYPPADEPDPNDLPH